MFSKYGPSAQITMPARRASKFCAKRCAALPHICVPQLHFLGNSWDDRTFLSQNVNLNNPGSDAADDDGDGDEPTTATPPGTPPHSDDYERVPNGVRVNSKRAQKEISMSLQGILHGL